MTKTLNNINCSHHLPIKQSEKALFAKMICNSYDQAVALLKGRNLGPGELAVVRYYINDADEWNDATGLPVRMILGIGGANAQSDDDVFIFNDSRIFGEDYVTADDVERMIINALDLYATKDDLAKLEELFKIDEDWKKLVNNSFKENTADHENFSRDIDELRSKLDNLSETDLSDYYTKSEIDKLFDEIEIPEINLSDYYKKSEIDDKLEAFVTEDILLQELDNKADVSDVEDVSNKLSTKADIETVNKISDELDNKVDVSTLNSTVENLVNDALENSSTITNAVNSAIESADIPGQVASAVEGMDLVSNEQLTTEVQNQIKSSEIIKELQTKVETLDHLDGEELDIWYLTFASSEDDINTAIINNENVELESDIALTSTLIFDENSDMAINIADSQLTKSGTGAVIRVNGGKLIIDGNSGHIDGNNNGIESGDNNAVRCSENGHIIINGGYFTVGDDGKNTGNALIYCTEGIIEIYGGTFEYTNSNNGRIYTLNCQDANYKVGKAKIIVYGGTFLNGYDPADSKSENPAGNFVANGYKSVYNENNN